jgi:spermidine synthase
MTSTNGTWNGTSAVRRGLLYALSFWGGFQIMALEICGMRLLQTNVGSSVVVTGALLTLVMISLAVGYALGGLASARVESLARLFAWLLGAGAYTQVANALLLEPVVFWADALKTSWPIHNELRTIIPAALVTLVLYGAPMLILSMISPFLVRSFAAQPGQAGDRRANAGYRSGFIMSLSTAGSIAGTLLSSYVLIPWLGVERTTAATNAVLVLLAGANWWWSQRTSAAPAPRAQRWAVVAAFAAVLLGFAVPRPAPDPSVVYEAESAYGRIQVVQSYDSAGRRMLVYHPSRHYTHSLVYPDEPLRDLPELMYLAPTRFEPPRDILVLGSAAGGILRRIEVAFPDARVVGVDVDPKVHDVARDIFKVNLEQSRLVTADARMFLEQERGRYDFIIIDLFAGEFIPSHCISVEFFELVREHLTERGSIFLNTNMQDIHYELADAEPFRAVRHLQSTLRAAGFPSVMENSFFQSLFAFPFELSAAQLRADLLAAFRDERRALPLRVGAALAAYTTLPVPPHAASYRPFSDRWLPTLLVELRTNAAAIYAALERGPFSLTSSAPASQAPEVAEHALRARWAELSRSNQTSLRDVGGLIARLNGLDRPLGASAVDVAAAYFRFPYYREIIASEIEPVSAWANLASLYAEMYTLGYRNEYEALLRVLETIDERVTQLSR